VTLSARVRRFLERDIDSLETLELLLLLRKNPECYWSSDEIVAELRSTPFSIRQRIQTLRRLGLIAERTGGGWCYAADGAMERLIAETADAYRDLRLRVIEAVYHSSTEPFREFSDAFRIKEREDYT
jgi:hypothetical protein